MEQPIVYIVNKGAHNFGAARWYGQLVYLSDGPINRYACNNMYREFKEIMVDSCDCDYIIPCSLNVMNSIACALFVHKHNKLNLLLYKSGKYVERNLVFD